MTRKHNDYIPHGKFKFENWAVIKDKEIGLASDTAKITV